MLQMTFKRPLEGQVEFAFPQAGGKAFVSYLGLIRASRLLFFSSRLTGPYFLHILTTPETDLNVFSCAHGDLNVLMVGFLHLSSCHFSSALSSSIFPNHTDVSTPSAPGSLLCLWAHKLLLLFLNSCNSLICSLN